VHRKLNFLDK